jgi:hypothetical protein
LFDAIKNFVADRLGASSTERFAFRGRAANQSGKA